MKLKFFKTSNDLRQWLEKNHNRAPELWIGFYKLASGRKSIHYHEALDAALCYGWIDGVRKSVDDISYTTRFSPRRSKSTWSKVNIERFNELKQLGLVAPAGEKVFEARDEKRSGYSLKDRPIEIEKHYEKKFKQNKKAWEFFQSQAPGYRKNAMWWVTSAKQEETRERRFTQLIEDCANGIRVGVLTPSLKSKQKK